MRRGVGHAPGDRVRVPLGDDHGDRRAGGAERPVPEGDPAGERGIVDAVGELGIGAVRRVDDRHPPGQRLLAVEAGDDDDVLRRPGTDVIDERLHAHRLAGAAGVDDLAAHPPLDPARGRGRDPRLVVELEHHVPVPREHRRQRLPRALRPGVGQRAARRLAGRGLGLEREDHRQPQPACGLHRVGHLVHVGRGVQRALGIEPELADLEADEIGMGGDRRLELGVAELLVSGDVLAAQRAVGRHQPDDLHPAGHPGQPVAQELVVGDGDHRCRGAGTRRRHGESHTGQHRDNQDPDAPHDSKTPAGQRKLRDRQLTWMGCVSALTKSSS